MDYLYYLRKENMPHIWCDGCGNGIVLKSLLRVINKLGWDKNDIALVSGIGCSSRTPGYVDFNTLHTTHGRALAFATGLKIAKPQLHVIVVSGDGDATAIGGNHFIHAARRNIDITMIIFNNMIYGMTGGQVSPTTPTGKMATTAPYGNPDRPFDISRLAVAAGASYVARSTVYHYARLDKYIEQALTRKGFAVVEVLTPCPTSYGRMNKEGGGADMLLYQKENTVSLEKASGMSPEELQNKLVVGVFVDRQQPDYQSHYETVATKARAEIK
ncbi:MAG TPA: 2-oxoacid:ferredoxin oxidoreductase subunit beta [Candidatus Marinimicrobia bacterium]|nr:2-oxoacid:ferredoxin oxidoreductase subunit beta [Candidatus Neomarinimicrobiota bacterium]HRU92786.1 2-oxoacid:ferredoxin oxidoreductase subunit beta [Candidatus Neomarinimicrobiota bacterium]